MDEITGRQELPASVSPVPRSILSGEKTPSRIRLSGECTPSGQSRDRLLAPTCGEPRPRAQIVVIPTSLFPTACRKRQARAPIRIAVTVRFRNDAAMKRHGPPHFLAAGEAAKAALRRQRCLSEQGG